MSDDDDRTPMTRTELAMLWDLAGRWLATHPAWKNEQQVEHLRLLIDDELADRFGG